MDFTGERMDNHENSLMYQISLERYKFASNYLQKISHVLDFGCGTGYGTNYLKPFAKEIIGYDIDKRTIKKAIKEYGQHFTDKLPTKKDFDSLICFEIIEHVNDPKKLIDYLSGHLKKDGLLILSTPNNFNRIHPPKNRFHIKEFELKELYGLLSKKFKHVDTYGQLKTNYDSNKPIPKVKILKRIIKYIFDKVYGFDLQHTHFLEKIEHTQIYKRIGDLQRTVAPNPSIYKIDLHKPYYIPEISIYVCRK